MDKQELIRKSAIAVFANKGFHDSTVKEIAEKAGIAVGTVYLYFKSKEDILDHIFFVEHLRRVELLKEHYCSEDNIEKVLDSFFDLHFELFTHEQDTTKVLFQELHTVMAIKDRKSKDGMEQVFSIFSDILKKEQQNGRISTDMNTELLSYIIILLTRNYCEKLYRGVKNIDYEIAKKNLKAIILHGILI